MADFLRSGVGSGSFSGSGSDSASGSRAASDVSRNASYYLSLDDTGYSKLSATHRSINRFEMPVSWHFFY